MDLEKEQTHLIIDGYNVAHAWGLVDQRSDRWIDEVVNTLQTEMRSLHDEKNWRITVVFDGKEKEVEIQRPFVDESFSILFSPASLTADAVIEQLVSGHRSPESIRVATEDRAIIHSIEASGAEAISPNALRGEIDSIERYNKSRGKKHSGESENAFENKIPL